MPPGRQTRQPFGGEPETTILSLSNCTSPENRRLISLGIGCDWRTVTIATYCATGFGAFGTVIETAYNSLGHFAAEVTGTGSGMGLRITRRMGMTRRNSVS